jgi:hypothetical protein
VRRAALANGLQQAAVDPIASRRVELGCRKVNLRKYNLESRLLLYDDRHRGCAIHGKGGVVGRMDFVYLRFATNYVLDDVDLTMGKLVRSAVWHRNYIL